MSGIFAPHGVKFTPDMLEPKPGMLRVEAMIVFRDETTMLDFAGTIRVEVGALRAVYHYDPSIAIVFTGVTSASDISRLLLYAAEFPGVKYAAADLETVLPVENTGGRV